jgi:hypothetical protein
MEHLGSLQRLQESSNCPYPEREYFSPCYPTLYLQDPSKYYTPAYVFVLLVGSFLRL